MDFGDIFGLRDEAPISQEESFRTNIDIVIQEVRDGVYETNALLRGIFGAKYLVDEMALMLPNVEAAMMFVSVLVEQEGFKLFNYTSDIVRVKPIPAEYGVRYWFVSTPYDFRIEVMALEVSDRSYSPFHQVLQNAMPESSAPAAVHASFKVADEEAFANAVHLLTTNDHDVYQHCESSYGKFSYLGRVRDFGENCQDRWAIKPRLNVLEMKINMAKQRAAEAKQ